MTGDVLLERGLLATPLPFHEVLGEGLDRFPLVKRFVHGSGAPSARGHTFDGSWRSVVRVWSLRPGNRRQDFPDSLERLDVANTRRPWGETQHLGDLVVTHAFKMP